ncbi:MAG: hypothetical protein ACP5C3_05615 [Methanomicrobiales archaeon]
MLTLRRIINFKAYLILISITLLIFGISIFPTYAYNDDSIFNDTQNSDDQVLINTNLGTNSTNTSNIKTSNTPIYTIKTFDKNVGADVTKNPEIKNNIPQTTLSKTIIKYQKNGSTIIQFGNGNGKKLLIWAGIHGNEEEANIAAMKYIEYLKNKEFDGTIYIIPFAIPKSTAMNSRNYAYVKYSYTVKVRYKKWYRKSYRIKVRKWYRSYYRYRGHLRYKWRYRWVYKTVYRKKYRWLTKKVTKKVYGYADPNRMANVPGSPGWKAVQFAKNNGISYILDVHSGGGVKNHTNGLVYATPGWKEESNWAGYIKSCVGSTVGVGNSDPGMLNVYGNNCGINTLTIEVERDAGSTLYWANIEFNMIKAACKYLFPKLN